MNALLADLPALLALAGMCLSALALCLWCLLTGGWS